MKEFSELREKLGENPCISEMMCSDYDSMYDSTL